MNDQFDFIAIGDTVSDDFIRLKDAHVHCKIDTEQCELCVRFGDKVPFESSTVVWGVGNAANAVVSATRLGLKTAFITDIGGDESGKRKIESFQKNGVDTRYVKVHEDMKSNFYYVLWYGVERTILVNHQEYSYALPEDIQPTRWLYFSSVAKNGLPYHHEIVNYLKKHSETKLSFQPGTFQMSLGYEAIKDIYERADIFFCNKEEAQRILENTESDFKKLAEALYALGPKIVCITDGPNGAYAFDGNELWYTPMYPDLKPPVDRTGAGDAFASTFTVAIGLGKSVPEALSWGPINSMSVVQYIGAQEGLLTRDKLEEYLKNAPANYKPEKIN